MRVVQNIIVHWQISNVTVMIYIFTDRNVLCKTSLELKLQYVLVPVLSEIQINIII